MAEHDFLYCTEDMPAAVECQVSFHKSSTMVFLMDLADEVHVDEHGHVHIGPSSWSTPVASDVIPLGSQSSCDDY